MTSPLVSTAWLADHLNDSNLIVLDTSMDKVVGKEKRLYEQQLYIPNSLRCDLEQVLCDTQSPVANAFPTAAQGQAFAQANGLNAFNIPVTFKIAKPFGHIEVTTSDEDAILEVYRGFWFVWSAYNPKTRLINSLD